MKTVLLVICFAALSIAVWQAWRMSRIEARVSELERLVGHGQFKPSQVVDPAARFGGKTRDLIHAGECDTLTDGRLVKITAVYPDGSFDAQPVNTCKEAPR